MPPTNPRLRPIRSPLISPPTIIPASPRRIVAQIGIGSGPGNASLARAPTTRPPRTRPMMKISTSASLPRDAASNGGGAALGRAGASTLREHLAVARRRRRHELAEQARRRGCDLVDRARERSLVRLRRLREAADLAHVLDGCGAHLVVGGRRLEVVQRVDVAAHAVSPVR